MHREAASVVTAVVCRGSKVVLLRRNGSPGYELVRRALAPGQDPAQVVIDSVVDDLGVSSAVLGFLGRFRSEDGVVLAYVVNVRGELRPRADVAEVLLTDPDALELRVALPSPLAWPLDLTVAAALGTFGELPILDDPGAPVQELLELVRLQQVDDALELAAELAEAAGGSPMLQVA